MKKIGILTGGADCPGLNSVIRAVVRKSMQEGILVTGIKNGWYGLIDNNMRVLDIRLTTGILDRGGTILGTSRIVPPLSESEMKNIEENLKRNGIDSLIAVGGEYTLKIALSLYEKYNIPVVGVPKSIDNDLYGTDYAFGFDTAVNIATECIDRLHTTAESHHRIIVVEVMGRHTGWIAIEAGIAGGANIILTPEVPINIEKLCNSLKDRHKRGQSFSIVVVSEGANIEKANKGKHKKKNEEANYKTVKIGEHLASLIESNTGYETRVSVLGHILRGGTPTAYDRVIGTRFGVKAVEFAQQGKFGEMVSLRDNKLSSVKIKEVVKKRKEIDKNLLEISRVFGE